MIPAVASFAKFSLNSIKHATIVVLNLLRTAKPIYGQCIRTRFIRGELRLKLGQTKLAEVDFHRAIALATKMSAKAWQLRATTSLARLPASQGGRHEVRTLLSEINNWFTEGFLHSRPERHRGAARGAEQLTLNLFQRSSSV